MSDNAQNRIMDQTATPVDSLAEQALRQAGEAMLAGIRRAFPNSEPTGDPARVMTDLDDSTLPPSVELRLDGPADWLATYQALPVTEQETLVHALQVAARRALRRAKPVRQFAERDADVHVFADQSAVEHYQNAARPNGPLGWPVLRAISWRQPRLLLGDNQRPTDINLFRLGYHELARAHATTFYRHCDPDMPTVGYGLVADQGQITLFRANQVPVVISVPLHGPGQLIDLHHPDQAAARLFRPVSETDRKRLSTNELRPDVEKTRYPSSLLNQVEAQFAVQLTGDIESDRTKQN